MTNKYEKSLELMTKYLESVSDEDFLAGYKLAEKFHGPSIEEFLGRELVSYSSATNRQSIHLNANSAINVRHMALVELKLNADESLYQANDESYALCAVA